MTDPDQRAGDITAAVAVFGHLAVGVGAAEVRHVVEALEPSADPVAVFRQLCDLVVPLVCDAASVGVRDMTDSAGTPSATVDGPFGVVVDGGPLSPAADGSGWSEVVVRVRIQDGAASDGSVAELVFRWRSPSGTADRVMAVESMCRHAAALVLHARQAEALRTTSLQVENLKLALTSNRIIGAAVGVLMTTHKMTYDQAFERLRVTSQQANRKIVDLARDVLYTGELAP